LTSTLAFWTAHFCVHTCPQATLVQEIKDIILNSMESPRFRDPLNRSTFKIEKTMTDPAGSKLTEPNSGIFPSPENQTSASMVVTALYVNGVLYEMCLGVFSVMWLLFVHSWNIFLLGQWNICMLNKGNNKITELRTILQRESQNS
jgi:hypothetical protein